MERHISAYITRIFINFYTINHVRVAWSDVRLLSCCCQCKARMDFESCTFRIYIVGLLVLLAKAGYGCYVGKHFIIFMGTPAHADDIVPCNVTYCALKTAQNMLDYHICFNTKKSKYLIVALYIQHNLQDNFLHWSIGSNSIETVDSFSHLGRVLTDDLVDSKDIDNRVMPDPDFWPKKSRGSEFGSGFPPNHIDFYLAIYCSVCIKLFVKSVVC
jgi:hypothetical protein